MTSSTFGFCTRRSVAVVAVQLFRHKEEVRAKGVVFTMIGDRRQGGK